MLCARAMDIVLLATALMLLTHSSASADVGLVWCFDRSGKYQSLTITTQHSPLNTEIRDESDRNNLARLRCPQNIAVYESVGNTSSSVARAIKILHTPYHTNLSTHVSTVNGETTDNLFTTSQDTCKAYETARHSSRARRITEQDHYFVAFGPKSFAAKVQKVAGDNRLNAEIFAAAVLKAIAKHESDFDPCSTSHTGARGFLQVAISTFKDAGATRVDPYDLQTNARYASDELSRKLSTIIRLTESRKPFGGVVLDPQRWLFYLLMLYNRGIGTFQKTVVNHQVSDGYADKVMRSAAAYCEGRFDAVNGLCFGRPTWFVEQNRN